MLVYLGYVLWSVLEYNHNFDDKQELIKEKDRWKDKFNDCLEDLDSVKKELKDAICRNDDLWKQNTLLMNESDVLTNKLTKYILRFGEMKETIAMRNQEEIIQYFNEWLSCREIAEKIWCSKSTIQRALKKWWFRN